MNVATGQRDAVKVPLTSKDICCSPSEVDAQLLLRNWN